LQALFFFFLLEETSAISSFCDVLDALALELSPGLAEPAFSNWLLC